jgi:dTDP-4-dehydrorhamnose reductase
MKILILGASGLIGHRLFLTLREYFQDVFCTLHGDHNEFSHLKIFNSNTFDNMDIRDFSRLESIMISTNPDIIINCVGITKRRAEINDLYSAITVNSAFPHKLSEWAGIHQKRVIHFSTDCVFDGKKGGYTEESDTNATDIYGKTKALGEIKYEHTLTIRSSFIGRELKFHSELLEWFLAQRSSSVKGFTNALYSGVSTFFLSRTVASIIENRPDLHGLYQLATDHPISKFELLSTAKKAFQVKTDIIPDESFVAKPTLNGSKLKNTMSLTIPDWTVMMEEIARNISLYPKI